MVSIVVNSNNSNNNNQNNNGNNSNNNNNTNSWENMDCHGSPYEAQYKRIPPQAQP